MTRIPGPRRVAVGALVVAAVLGGALASAGCSSDESDDAAPRGTNSTPSTTATTTVDSPDDVVPPQSVDDVAETLTRVERSIRSPAMPSEDLPRLGWEQQHAYRALAAHPEWAAPVVEMVPDDVRPPVAANELAGREVGTLAEPQPELPEWRIEAPPPPDVLIGFYREAEAASGIPWPYLASIHLVETRMGRIRGTSTAGAQGPMQFIPSTWAAYGEGDVNDNRDAILAAGRYLRASGGPDDMDAALYAYNPSDRYVRAIQSYAGLIRASELAYRGYYHWQVYYATTDGVMLLPEGYPREEAVDAPAE